MILITFLVQHACATCPSVINLKLVLASVMKEEEAGAVPMTVAECFEEARKKMAINGECIHELEKVCVDHFKAKGDAEKVREAESMIGSWERKVGYVANDLDMKVSALRSSSSKRQILPRWLLTIISVINGCILLSITG